LEADVMLRHRELLPLVLLFVVLNGPWIGCSARDSDEPTAVTERVEATGGSTTQVASREDRAGSDDEFRDSCHGVLSCTLFGLGAVIAAPFWVLGAVLGLVF
jgi:hypothetical protein